jgi:hypothetical protein
MFLKINVIIVLAIGTGIMVYLNLGNVFWTMERNPMF